MDLNTLVINSTSFYFKSKIMECNCELYKTIFELYDSFFRPKTYIVDNYAGGITFIYLVSKERHLQAKSLPDCAKKRYTLVAVHFQPQLFI